jgi:uncharacterized phage protein (TIGR02220 family)
MQGYIKLYRKLLASSIFHNEKLLKVWIWCLLKASHKGYKHVVGLQEIELSEGQFVTGRFKGSTELKMNPSTFYKYLISLKNLHMIELKSNNKVTVVTIVNWGKYQVEETESCQQNNNKITTKEQQSNTNKNDKNVKNEKNIYIPFPEIISYLNLKAKTNYKDSSSKTKKHITARWNEGYQLQDFYTVIDKKCFDWLNTEQAIYLRPETLFGTKFEGYLNQPKKRSTRNELGDLIPGSLDKTPI